MPAKRTANLKTMSKAHKAALAAGREDGWAVRRYLEALEANKPKRGRRRSAETIGAQLSEIDELLESASPLNRLQLVQRRSDLQREADNLEAGGNLEDLEDAFVAAAGAYSERKGITHDTWRKIGVSVDVLSRAGIAR